ncbi:MAG: ComF family protein [Bacteroidales bacterium]|jgi:ComF family protein|nr:ComF family protein [Bacteroidales bacterium]
MTRKKTFFDRLWISDVIHLFFPNACYACGEALIEQEEVVCSSCYFKLPKTGFHLHEDNIISQIFWGRVHIHSATSFLFFNKGGHVQRLMHALKYKGHKEVGVFMGRLFGESIKESPIFNTADMIVPIPLHPKKQYKRGFNQSEVIAKGMQTSLGIPVSINNLVRQSYTSSQTKKARYTRWENVKGVFTVTDANEFAGKHLILIDDVLTTGATMEACILPLLEIPDTKVSVATLAYAQV